MFNAKEQKNNIIKWICNWFQKNGDGCNAVVGISGGKDSAVTAALCVEALGKNKVYGIMLPDGEQKDIADSREICKVLDIPWRYFNIENAKKEFIHLLLSEDIMPTDQALTNLPARLRMVMLYAFAQSMNGRVANTCNLSEDYIGYSTKYGDAAGDFAPLKSFTSEEVIEIGRELGIPERFLVKPPSDGLCGKTDEENLGFTYAMLNKYIRDGEIEDQAIKEKIDRLHEINAFKEKVIERYEYKPCNM